MRFDTEDTIAAISTTPAEALRGILRISGSNTLSLVEKIFQTDEERFFSWTRSFGRVNLNDEIRCPAQLYIFRSPHSYTGQDVVELHLPGAPVLLQMVLESLLQLGARMAEPGEFTARAFFHGRMDLSEAEAVAEVISARSDAQLRGAERLLAGALHQKCSRITEQLTELLALVEANIDFTDQDIELVSQPQLTAQIQTVRNDLEQLLADSRSWEELSYLPRVVVAGPANAGKSCLTNALLGMDRSIVNSLAGTTRDLLTGPLHLTHGECLLIDSAGLGPVEDLLAPQAQQAAQQAIATCDFLLWVIDGSDTRSAKQFAEDFRFLHTLNYQGPYIAVVNKTDLCRDADSRLQILQQLSRQRQVNPIAVSALRGDHLNELKLLIEQTLHGGTLDTPGQVLTLTIRQREALQTGIENLHRAGKVVSEHDSIPSELVALELREALDHLGEITGEVVTEEVLGRIFSRFCIGK
jgi:tRNA modification GTPase